MSSSTTSTSTASTTASSSTTTRPYYPYEAPPDTMWFFWEFLLLISVYLFCFLIFAIILFLVIRCFWKHDHQDPPKQVPEQFSYVEEVKPNNQKILGIHDVASAFMISSELGKKFHNNETILTVAEEEEVGEVEEAKDDQEEASGSRPGSGILQETLEEIENEEEKPVDDGADNQNEDGANNDSENAE